MIDLPEQPEVFQQASQMFEDAIWLGTRMRVRAGEGSLSGLTQEEYKELRRLTKLSHALQGIEVVYSGEGFVPACDQNGNIFTVYGSVDRARGQLNYVYATDANDVTYLKPTDIELEEPDDADSTVGLLDETYIAMRNFQKSLKTSPPGMQLFVEFVLKHETGIDQPIRGHAVRVPEYTVYNIMSASSLEIVDINPLQPTSENLVTAYEVKDAIKKLSDHYRQNIRNKVFRNLPQEVQQKKIEQFLQRSNDLLRLDRFALYAQPDFVYLPNPEETSGFELCQVHMGFSGECVRFDCIETKLLSEGNPIKKRRGNVNSITSTCVVVEIDEVTKQRMDIDSYILWVPVTDQLDKMYFIEEGIFS